MYVKIDKLSKKFSDLTWDCQYGLCCEIAIYVYTDNEKNVINEMINIIMDIRFNKCNFSQLNNLIISCEEHKIFLRGYDENKSKKRKN